MKKSIKIVMVILLIMILCLCNVSNAAKVKVTKEKLKKSFKGLKNLSSDTSDVNIDKNFDIEVTDDIITVFSEGEKCEIKYSLKNKPTFVVEALIKDGMSYEEFQNETSKLSMPMLAYVAICNIQGIEYEDSMLYITMNLLGSAFSGGMGTTSEYVLYDDTNSDVAVDIVGDKKVIKASEFDKYVMEYVNAAYNDSTVKDSEGVNSFEWITKKENVTDKSCKLVSKMSIDLDADFSKLMNYEDEFKDSFSSSSDNSVDNSIFNDEANNNINEYKNTVDGINTIPNAGIEFGTKDILKIIIFVSILSICIILVTSKKENN